MCRGSIEHLPYLSEIHYRIILSLMKGSAYQGIVCISFHLGRMTDQMQHLSLHFNGVGVKLLMVNNLRIDARDVRFVNHKIEIGRGLLRENGRNQIQVIFENHYSFLNEGLSTYFKIDENNKYSLRQQVIYSCNGYLQVERIIPCINCMNECRVVVEVIHPDTFDVFSNSSKSVERFCSVIEYQKYPFLFDHSSNSLNRTFKMNASTVSMADSGVSQYSSSNFYNRKKANSHFYPSKLPSIHHFFIFSSQMVQVLPSHSNNPLQQKLMLRYFCKNEEFDRIQRGIDQLHGYVLQVLRKINEGEKVEMWINKIDVVIVGDKQSEGRFSIGGLMLYHGSLGGGIGISTLYLIARALYGMVLLAKGEKILTIQQVLKLNEMVFNRFQQFRNYLFLVNQQYSHIRTLLSPNNPHKAYIHINQGHFLCYFHKQMRVMVLSPTLHHSLSFQMQHLVSFLKQQSKNQFWQTFLANYNFLSPLIIEPLLRLSLSRLGMPVEQGLRQQLKVCFSGFRYSLAFYTNKEIEENLPKFMEYQPQGLEQRLTKLKVKQKFKDFITEKYQKYLPVKSNIAQAEIIYNQFKKFNQVKNFHHYSLLHSQINRVQSFGESFIKAERISAECSLSAWRLLLKLKIYPLDEQYYTFLRIVHDIQQK